MADRDAVQSTVEGERRDQAGRDIGKILDRRVLLEGVERLEQAQIPRDGTAVEQVGDVETGG